MIIFRKSFFTFWLLLNSVLALVITQNRVDRGVLDVSVGNITINSGASWSIINNAISTLVGSLTVQPNAGLYITSTSPLLSLQVTLTSLLSTIQNNGIIAFNSSPSLTSSTYNLVGLSLVNTGEMYFSASGVLPSVMALTAASWSNSGLMAFYQNQRSSGIVSLGTPSGSITNNGQICLINEVYKQTTSINGSGCFTANRNSTIYIANVLLPVSTSQNFYLADSQSSIIVQAISTPQVFNVYGFGNGNMVGVTLPLIGNIWNPAYSYNPSTGILRLRNFFVYQDFNIGPGYNPSLFSIVTDDGAGIPSTILGSVSYSGPVPPRALPASCKIACKPVPTAPGTNPTEYTTTLTTTNSAGKPLTETGVVDISTDSNGSWFSSTTIFPTSSSSSSSSSTVSSTAPSSSSTKPSSSSQPSSTPPPSSSSKASSITPSSSNQFSSTTPSSSTEASSTVPSSSSQLSLTVPLSSSESLSSVPSSDNGSSSASAPASSQSSIASTTEFSSTIPSSIHQQSLSIQSPSSQESSVSSTPTSSLQSSTNTISSSQDSSSFSPTTSDDSSINSPSSLSDSSTSNVSSTDNTESSVASAPPTDSAISATSSDITIEFTSTWEVTNSDGSVSTESGIVSESGSSLTTLTTFATSGAGQSEFTSTWEVTNSDGSVFTESGIISQSGTSIATLTTFPEPAGTVYPVTTLFTTEYVTTCPNGELSTATGVVVVSTDSKGIEQTVTSVVPSTVYTKETVTSIITHCIKNKCFESTTTLVSSVPCPTQVPGVFTSTDNGHGVPIASIDVTTGAATVSNTIKTQDSTGFTSAGNAITTAITATGAVTTSVGGQGSTDYSNAGNTIAAGSGSDSGSGSGSGSGSSSNTVGIVNPKVSSAASGITVAAASASAGQSWPYSSGGSGNGVLPSGANNVGSNQTPTVSGGNSNPSTVTGAAVGVGGVVSGSPSYSGNSLLISFVSSQSGAISSSTGVTIPIATENSGSKFSVGKSAFIAIILTTFIGFI